MQIIWDLIESDPGHCFGTGTLETPLLCAAREIPF
jgi:hypothetical protein